MNLAIIGVTVASGVIASLRYHALIQGNNYKIDLSDRFIQHFILVLVLQATVATVFTLGWQLNINALTIVSAVLSVIVLAALFLKYCLQRTKLKLTNRAKSFFLTSALIYLFAQIGAVVPIKDIHISVIVSLSVAVAYPLFIFIALCIINPYFENKNRKFINAAKEKLAKTEIIKIGITGSYGKTSCKNILKTMLEEKFTVAASKENFNTPMGLAFTINDLKDEEILIAEMGARKVGDIKELSEMIEPDYAILTGVAAQHLKTFGTLHNIYCEKQMLAKSVEANGTAVFNGNDRLTFKMFKEHSGKKFKACVNKCGDIYAENIITNLEGMSFDLIIEDERLNCQTKLLGKHNIQNIAMCATIAHCLGVENASIAEAIKKLKSTPHRLEYIYSNGVHILDDSYNANMQGIKSACECLSTFSGRKIVLAQGIVEQGRKQYETNTEAGKLLSKVADIVILTGSNTRAIKNGLTESDFSGQIIKCKNLKHAQRLFSQILNAGDTLLLQNDLPDIY